MEGLEEILSYCETMEKFEFDKNQIDIFKKTSDASRERIKKAQLERIEDLARNHENNGTFKLHEGFEKNCGLKGSKLSGGQK